MERQTIAVIRPVLGAVTFEALLEEVHGLSVAATDYPVESGARLTDHSIVEPETLRLRVADGRAVEVFDALHRQTRERAVFDVVTGLHHYRDMQITDMSATRDASSATILDAVVDLKSLRFATPERVAGGFADGFGARPEAAGASASRAAPASRQGAPASVPQNRGDNATEDVEPGTPDHKRSQSVLFNLLGGTPS